jgi:hypothetical protein
MEAGAPNQPISAPTLAVEAMVRVAEFQTAGRLLVTVASMYSCISGGLFLKIGSVLRPENGFHD